MCLWFPFSEIVLEPFLCFMILTVSKNTDPYFHFPLFPHNEIQVVLSCRVPTGDIKSCPEHLFRNTVVHLPPLLVLILITKGKWLILLKEEGFWRYNFLESIFPVKSVDFLERMKPGCVNVFMVEESQADISLATVLLCIWISGRGWVSRLWQGQKTGPGHCRQCLLKLRLRSQGGPSIQG